MTISIHALFAEGDLAVAALPAAPGNFYPRPLRRGRPIASGFMPGRMNFYPRPLRRGRLCRLHLFRLERGISIHALFAEGDTVFICASPAPISFLSTPSSQRATGSPGGGCAGEAHFYPRPLRRGRPIIRDMFHWYVHISIHALFAEGDQRIAGFPRACPISIHALFPEGDKESSQTDKLTFKISIHALFAEGDVSSSCCYSINIDFYPRPLRRGRRGKGEKHENHRNISIHALFAEGDAGVGVGGRILAISIHALFAEGDS